MFIVSWLWRADRVGLGGLDSKAPSPTPTHAWGGGPFLPGRKSASFSYPELTWALGHLPPPGQWLGVQGPCQLFCSAWGVFPYSQEAAPDVPLLPGLAVASTWGQEVSGWRGRSCDDMRWLDSWGNRGRSR